jgi:hypothetical protein
LLGLLLVAACDRDGVAPANEAPVAPGATAIETDGASQADLARDLEAAETDGDYAPVVARWQGRRVRWTVWRTAPLCRSAASCNVRAFNGPRPKLDAGHGWLPRLALSPAEFAKITAGCGSAPSCELVVEGRLSQLDASAEDPTTVEFDDVIVISAATAGSRS